MIFVLAQLSISAKVVSNVVWNNPWLLKSVGFLLLSGRVIRSGDGSSLPQKFCCPDLSPGWVFVGGFPKKCSCHRGELWIFLKGIDQMKLDGAFLIFIPIWRNDPIWLSFFRWVGIIVPWCSAVLRGWRFSKTYTVWTKKLCFLTPGSLKLFLESSITMMHSVHLPLDARCPMSVHLPCHRLRNFLDSRRRVCSNLHLGFASWNFHSLTLGPAWTLVHSGEIIYAFKFLWRDPY